MERIDDLQVNGLRLIQDDEYFCFGTDSVELANFVSCFRDDRVIDLGAGSGIISVLLSGKKGVKTTAVEIDSALCALIERNIALNGLNSLADVINLPIQQLKTRVKTGEYTVVVSNPPYFKTESGFVSTKKALARHEVALNQRELIETAAYLLNDGGKFFIVYPVNRLAELLSTCVEFKLEPKELVILNPKNKPPHLFLLRCVKNAKSGIKVTSREVKNFGMGDE